MMRYVLFLLFCFVISSVKPAVYRIHQIEIPGHKGQCYNDAGKIFYNKGEIIKNEELECIQRKCLGLDEEIRKLTVEILTCPKVKAGLGYKIMEDKSKPYPECCPRPVPDSNQTGLDSCCRSEKIG